MGKLALTIGGAVVGSFFGAPQIGAMIGGIVGSVAFPVTTKTQGPRLTDLLATSSTEGAPNMRGFGTVGMGGNAIFCPGLVETSTVTKVGGKGGPVQKTTTYAYTSTFAIGFGQGVAVALLKMWFDEKIVVDTTGESEFSVIEGLSYRFYTGAEDQEPDPALLKLGDPKDTPAFRGQAYVVVDNMDMAQWGNRPIPNVRALIAWEGAESNPVVVNVPALSGGIPAVLNANFNIVDPARGYTYISNNSPGALRRINTRTMTEDRQALYADIMAGTSWPTQVPIYAGGITPSGKLIMSVGSFNDTPMILVDPSTLARLSIWGAQDIAGDWTPGRAPPIVRWATARATYMGGQMGEINDYAVGAGFFADGNVGIWRTDQAPEVGGALNQIGYIWDSQTFMGGLGLGAKIFPLTRVDVNEGLALIWVFGSVDTGGGTEIGVGCLEIYLSASYKPDQFDSGVTLRRFDPIAVGDMIPGATSYYTMLGCWRDDTDGTVVFLVQPVINQYQLFKWNPVDGQIEWTTDITGSYAAAMVPGGFVLKGNSFGFVNSSGVGARVDTRTGKFIDTGINFGVTYSDSYRATWDALTQSFWVPNGGADIMRRYIFGRLTSAPADLGDVCRAICGFVNLGPGDVDASQLDGKAVPGYALTSSGMTARSSIEQLRDLYFFDVVESDYKLIFKPRGSASVRTIDAGSLLPVDTKTNLSWQQTNQLEQELPERLTYAYQASERQYLPATQQAKRTVAPRPAVYSVQQDQMEFTAALGDTQAAQAVEVKLYNLWMEQDKYHFMLDWTNIDLDPADVITVNPTPNSSFLTRIATSEVGANWAMDINGVAEEVGLYTSTAPGVPGTGQPVSTIPSPAPFELVLIDSPLLRNQDEVSNRTGAPIYYGMGAYHPNDRVRGNLYRSPGDGVWTYTDRRIIGIGWGGCATALPDTPNPWITDNDFELVIWMQDGADRLESVTQLQMLNGANTAAVINTSGVPEIIQFRDVVQNDNGSFTLTGLMRARRGTDTLVGTHNIGDLFVLLDPDTIGAFVLNTSDRNVPRFYKAVPDGKRLDEITETQYASPIRGLMPYAPVHIAATIALNNDITLTWVRRDRLGYDLVDDFQDQPLSENREQYTVYVYDGPDVVHTEIEVLTPTWTYTEAEQIADGFTPPLSTIDVRIPQISAQVGEGFALTQTLIVIPE